MHCLQRTHDVVIINVPPKSVVSLVTAIIRICKGRVRDTSVFRHMDFGSKPLDRSI